jgi:hypothetical protein
MMLIEAILIMVAICLAYLILSVALPPILLLARRAILWLSIHGRRECRNGNHSAIYGYFPMKGVGGVIYKIWYCSKRHKILDTCGLGDNEWEFVNGS